MKDAVARVIAAHHAQGKEFVAGGVRSFVLAEGEGEPIVLFHGIPASSFLYRKVIPRLAARGFQALAFDLPGLGFSERPVDFDYTFAGLGRWAAQAVDALGLARFHLVVHDAGGPVGFEMAATMPARIRSWTSHNTAIALDEVPFAMEFYARFATGEHWPALPPPRATRELLYRVGIQDRSATPPEEVDVYRELVLREDNGRAYLHLMRNLDHTRKAGIDYTPVVDTRRVPYPVQVIWSADDLTLPLRRHGWKARAATGLPTIQTLPGKHYFQEDRAPEIAAMVAEFASRTH